MIIHRNFYFLCNSLNCMLHLRKPSFLVPYSKFNLSFLTKLQVLGFVNSFTVQLVKKNYFGNGRLFIRVSFLLREGFVLPFQGISLLYSLKKSSSGILSYNKLLKQRVVPGVLILSTKDGLLTRAEALNKKIGGIPLVRIW